MSGGSRLHERRPVRTVRHLQAPIPPQRGGCREGGVTASDRAVIRETVALLLMVSRPGYSTLDAVAKQRAALQSASKAWEAEAEAPEPLSPASRIGACQP